MRLKYPKSFHKKLSVRPAIWYSGVCLLSSLIFAVRSFLLVFSAVRHSRVAIQTALLQDREKAEGGVSALAKLLRQQVHPSRTNSPLMTATSSWLLTAWADRSTASSSPVPTE
jgi:hypothetical protein